MKTTSAAAQPHVHALRSAPRGGVDVASELRRLMPRDRWLIDLLGEHQVFSTEQVAALGFDHVHTAQNRRTALRRRGILARFRDAVRPGSQAWRWTLDLVGATYLAARGGDPTPKAATIRHRINRLASSPHLAHLLAVNGLFVDLAAHARRTPGTRLDTWWAGRVTMRTAPWCSKATHSRCVCAGQWHRVSQGHLAEQSSTHLASRCVPPLSEPSRQHSGVGNTPKPGTTASRTGGPTT